MDLVNGLSSREISVDFIRKETRADGIISTKQPQIRRAKELGLYTVHRFFVIDSAAYENVEKCTKALRPDCVELMPGVDAESYSADDREAVCSGDRGWFDFR